MNTMRRLGPILAAAAVLSSACDAPPPPEAAPGPSRSFPDIAPVPDGSAAPGGCPAPGVAIREGGSDAAMGLRVVTLEMVNCGTRPFTVKGYPDLRLLDEDRAPLAVRVVRGSTEISRIESFEQPPVSVVLRPGERATAGLVWKNTVTDVTRPAAHGAYLDIAPVAGMPRQRVTPEGPIDLGTTGRLGVGAWQRSR
ncbi:DUF4232 domain-containing protein [Streptomyces sp. SYSU K21746]